MRFRLRQIAIVLLSLVVGASAGPVIWQFSNVTLVMEALLAEHLPSIRMQELHVAVGHRIAECTAMLTSLRRPAPPSGGDLQLRLWAGCSNLFWLKPDSTEVLFLASNASVQTGGRACAVFHWRRSFASSGADRLGWGY